MSASGHGATTVRKRASVTGDKAEPRGERTRHAIRAAFQSLLMNNGYQRLTINAVVERAGVGRSTFYEHFKTKEELLRESLGGRFALLAQMIGETQLPPDLVPLLEHFKQNQRLARALFGSPARRVIVASLREQITPQLRRLVSSYGAIPLISIELIALQLAQAQLTLLEEWLLGRFACRPEILAQALFVGANAMVAALLRTG